MKDITFKALKSVFFKWYNIDTMKVFFSVRHGEALSNETLKVSFPFPCRWSIERILQKYSVWGGWDDAENFTFVGASEDLMTFYGGELKAFDDNSRLVQASLSQVILKGLPQHVLDVIEAWFYQNPKESRECEKELNDILIINNLPWRIVNGNAVLVDSEYLHREVRAVTIHLLEEGKVAGALEEYQDAIDDLISGDTKDAINKAHKSVESVMKTVLGTREHLKPGELLRQFIDSGKIPEYYEDFLKHFEQLVYAITKERNLPGRAHGQGISAAVVPRCLAEFAVNLAGAVNVFIIKHWIEKKQDEPEELEPDDIPF